MTCNLNIESMNRTKLDLKIMSLIHMVMEHINETRVSKNVIAGLICSGFSRPYIEYIGLFQGVR